MVLRAPVARLYTSLYSSELEGFCSACSSGGEREYTNSETYKCGNRNNSAPQIMKIETAYLSFFGQDSGQEGTARLRGTFERYVAFFFFRRLFQVALNVPIRLSPLNPCHVLKQQSNPTQTTLFEPKCTVPITLTVTLMDGYLTVHTVQYIQYSVTHTALKTHPQAKERQAKGAET